MQFSKPVKLLCIKEENERHSMKVKFGDIYEGVIGFCGTNSDTDYWIVNFDRSGRLENWVFSKSTFMYLAEWREQQLNSILNG